MQLTFRRFDLHLTHTWMIASNVAQGGKRIYPSVLLELRDEAGISGVGEASPSIRYMETAATAAEFLQRVDPARLSFADIEGSMAYVESMAAGNFSPKGALNIALLDGAAKLRQQPLHDYLGLGFAERKHVTSFTIGIDTPDVIRGKVREAEAYPVLKIKVGGPLDEQNLAAVREVAPAKTLRVDANEGWSSKEEALRRIEALARDTHIEFIEQPMPAGTAPEDFAWLKERSPLPIFADESYLGASDVGTCAGCFDGVNVKLCKTGGVSRARQALAAARQAGLKTMLGCMIESSILISAAAHLAELTDYLDIDGNVLINNDPYCGVSSRGGMISFAEAPEPFGLRVRAR